MNTYTVNLESEELGISVEGACYSGDSEDDVLEQILDEYGAEFSDFEVIDIIEDYEDYEDDEDCD